MNLQRIQTGIGDLVHYIQARSSHLYPLLVISLALAFSLCLYCHLHEFSTFGEGAVQRTELLISFKWVAEGETGVISFLQRFLLHSYSFSTLLILPFFFLWPHQNLFFLIQLLALNLAVYPVFLLVKNKYKSNRLALIFSLAFFSLASYWILLFASKFIEFLAIPTLLAAFYFYEKDKLKPYLLFASIALLCKINIAAIFLLWGLYAKIDGRDRRWVLSNVVLGGSLLVIYFFILPEEVAVTNFKHHYGASHHELVASLLTEPVRFLKHRILSRGPLTLANFFRVHGLLPLLSPMTLLLSLPLVLEFLLHTRPLSLASSQFILLFPLFIYGAIVGIKRLSAVLAKHCDLELKKITVLIICLLVINNLAYLYAMPQAGWDRLSNYSYYDCPVQKNKERLKALNSLSSLIPTNQRVAADTTSASALSHTIDQVLVLRLRENDSQGNKLTIKEYRPPYVLLNRHLLDCFNKTELEYQLITRGGYKLHGEKGGFVLLRKRG